MAALHQIVDFLDHTLANASVAEKYATNGLQIESSQQDISKIGFCVDACLETFQLLSQQNCQLVVVHHGLFWPSLSKLTGATAKSVEFLLQKGISLYANHLPLDCHPLYGNNAQIAQLLGGQMDVVFPPVGWMVELEQSMPVETFHAKVQAKIGPARLLHHGKSTVQRIAISSGGASNSMIGDAVKLGADLFLTGEASHPIFHASKEAGLSMILAGHYATEVWGVKALMPLLQQQFDVQTTFVDVPTGF